MNIICNTHEIEEKEIACRCLYQYCNDIPYFLWEYSSLIIQSLESSIVSQLHKSEDLFIIISAIIILTIKMCLKYSIRNDIINVNDSNDHNNNNDRNNDNNNKEIENINIMNNITIKSLTHWNIALRQTLYFSQSSNSNDNNINNNNNNNMQNDLGFALIIIESINDVLKTRLNHSSSLYQSSLWPLFIPLDLIIDYIILLRDMSLIYVQRRILDPKNSTESGDEDEKVKKINFFPILIFFCFTLLYSILSYLILFDFILL